MFFDKCYEKTTCCRIIIPQVNYIWDFLRCHHTLTVMPRYSSCIKVLSFLRKFSRLTWLPLSIWWTRNNFNSFLFSEQRLLLRNSSRFERKANISKCKRPRYPSGSNGFPKCINSWNCSYFWVRTWWWCLIPLCFHFINLKWPPYRLMMKWPLRIKWIYLKISSEQTEFQPLFPQSQKHYIKKTKHQLIKQKAR